jgi:hypothetical protein
MSVVRPGFGFGWTVLRHGLQGWTLHLHTNGHNVKSWLLALGCGLAGQSRGGCVLTLHSGMVPGYLEDAPALAPETGSPDLLALWAGRLCQPGDQSALLSLGVESQRHQRFAGFSEPESPKGIARIRAIRRGSDDIGLCFPPCCSFGRSMASICWSPALARLNRLYPSFGCLVMGSGEQRAAAEQRVREAGLEEAFSCSGT